MLAVMAACMPPFRAYAQQPTTATSAELIQSDIDSLSTALNSTADGHTDDDREEAAKRLVALANERDGSDNATAQLIRVKSVERVGMYRGRPYKIF